MLGNSEVPQPFPNSRIERNIVNVVQFHPVF
jgi:hypothetical protein